MNDKRRRKATWRIGDPPEVADERSGEELNRLSPVKCETSVRVLEPDDPGGAPADWPLGKIGTVEALSQKDGVWRFAVALECGRTSTGYEVWCFSRSEILVLEDELEDEQEREP